MAKAAPTPETPDGPRSARKHAAILNAATEVFLRDGYPGASMDEIAALSAVSKQTIYKHFGSKEALFVEIVTSMTGAAGDMVHNDVLDLGEDETVKDYLEAYAYRQLSIVLTPRLMQLRRLVIAEVSRFPDLAEALYEHGPKRAVGLLAAMIERLAKRGLLTVDDPIAAATHFNWLVMSAPLNAAMLLGDRGIPKPAELKRQAEDGVRVFLAAYGRR